MNITTVESYPYKATVTERNGFYHLTCTYLDYPDPMTNAFLSDFNKAMAIGKALMQACPISTRYVGYSWDISPGSAIGGLTFRGRDFDKLPKVFSKSNGYEFGLALFQLGWTIQKKREVMALIERMNAPQKVAV